MYRNQDMWEEAYRVSYGRVSVEGRGRRAITFLTMGVGEKSQADETFLFKLLYKKTFLPDGQTWCPVLNETPVQ